MEVIYVKKYGTVFIVVNEGEVVYASEDQEAANSFCANRMYAARESVLSDWENDDPDEDDIMEADFQAGFDGGFHEVEEIDLTGLSENEMTHLADGTEIDVDNILDLLKKYKHDFEL